MSLEMSHVRPFYGTKARPNGLGGLRQARYVTQVIFGLSAFQ